MSNNDTFYITTPIYYPSDNLHIGHAYTTVAADTLARYHRFRGKDVWFLTGSDEHGQKIERKAKEMGMEPLAYVDKIVANFKHLWDSLHISYDDFIRTSEDRHKQVVQEIFTKIYNKGDIYKSTYEGLYCTPCETFWTDRQLEEKKCPDCDREVELLQEESYFFKMSKYQDRLLQYIEDNPDFIQPVSRRNEMVSFIKSGLDDLCVSRTTFDWGIPVPIENNHVIYVWFDALTNYISALGYGSGDPKYDKYWPCDVHLVGKDIVRFHTIIWPIILMAAEMELPKKVFGHGWLLLDQGKMSKSKGNVVDPLQLIDKYGVDAVRYFLLRDMPFGQDGYYSEEALAMRINTDLANDFGNLLSRTTAMINKFAQGVIPEPGAEEPLDTELKEVKAQAVAEFEDIMEKLELNNALAAVWKLINRSNKYIDETMPWALAKDEAKRDRLNTVLYNLAESLRIATVMITPFMPSLPEKVWQQLGIVEHTNAHNFNSIYQWGGLPVGVAINRGEPVFPRIDLAALREEASADKEEKQQQQDSKKKEKAKKKPEPPAEIGIDDFFKVQFKIAEVLECEKVPKADRLLKLTLDVAGEKKTVVSGIAEHYGPDEMVGKKVVWVANLKPAKLRGIESQGMILAASDDEGNLEVLSLKQDLPSGSLVK
ncbi:methionyl-tRNA synthetase [Desulfitispora alkaliphila]|uniref:methionine--tRNA ligase n=1 Tax=Desulfitispora alkaliphila TaxID=622674 RepID=UPI003D23E86F